MSSAGTPMSSTATATATVSYIKDVLIGKGAFGKVYLGMDKANGDLLAIKQVHMTASEDSKAVLREVKMLRDLEHPNLVQLRGVEEFPEEQRMNIIMEYAAGQSLDLLIHSQGKLVPSLTRNIVRQLVSVLTYLHAQGVVHRDVKGKNVMVDAWRRVKLADFGSAAHISEQEDEASMSYNYTPLWTAPEVLSGAGVRSGKVDVWSLGCTIIEMASGSTPWAEHSFSNPFKALFHIGSSEDVPAIPAGLSDAGRDFTGLCLTRDPHVRPSAAELASHPWLQEDV